MLVSQHIFIKSSIYLRKRDIYGKIYRPPCTKNKSPAPHRAGQTHERKNVNDITVKELVEEVDINRSTFYLHYTDIRNMLESVEQEMLEEIEVLIREHPIGLNENTFLFIADLFSIMETNKDLCAALIGPTGDMAFIYKIEKNYPGK